MEWIIARLSQPSTWRGLILIATALGVSLSDEMQEAILTGGLALVGLINVWRDEQKAAKKAAARVASAVAADTAQTAVEQNLPWLVKEVQQQSKE